MAINSRTPLLLLLLFFPLLPGKLYGQAFGPYFDPTVPVKDSTGVELPNPWTGGLNFCQFSRIDADRDGMEDLLVFDRSGDRLMVFLNENGDWRYSEAQNSRFPPLSDWVLARDFDNDGDKDLFTSSSGGIALYENSGGSTLSFKQISGQLLSDHYPDDPSTNPVNIYVQDADIPAIDDIDGDGDLDLLNFHILGTQVEYHRNVALETTGTTDTVIFERRNACWGFFSEGGSNSSITLDDSCSGNVQNPEGGGAHSGSTLLTLDMNGDGVKELVLGDISSEELTLLENDGGPSSSHMGNVVAPFPSGGNPVQLAIFPAAFYLDVDHDGVKDLLVSPNKGTTSEDRKSIWFYKNDGSNTSPNFSFQKRNFLQDSTIDLGEGAFPVFHDIDGDGDQDLFVGNQKLHDANGSQASSIAYLENTGSATSPSFHLRTSDYQDLSQVGMGQALHPSFGDLDGDGDADLLIGDSDGYLHYFENSSPVGDPPSYNLSQPQYSDSSGQTIDVGQFAAPTLVDLDRDMLLDLVIGEKGGNLVHYENVGSNNSPSFAHRTDSLGDVMVTAQGGFEGYSVPRFFEDSGDYELLVGSKSGRIFYYKGIDGNVNGNFQLATDHFGGLDAGKRSAPAVAELNGDQRKDMIMGSYGGGIIYYRGGAPYSGLSEEEEEEALRIWPNPVRSSGILHLKSRSLSRSDLRPSIHNVHGQRIPVQVRRERPERLTIELPELAPGLYFVRLERSGKTQGFIVR